MERTSDGIGQANGGGGGRAATGNFKAFNRSHYGLQLLRGIAELPNSGL